MLPDNVECLRILLGVPSAGPQSKAAPITTSRSAIQRASISRRHLVLFGVAFEKHVDFHADRELTPRAQHDEDLRDVRDNRVAVATEVDIAELDNGSDG